MRSSYAYSVMVAGQKRFGGVNHAESMEDAAVKAARMCKLTLETTELGTNWMFDGKRASLAVWTSPELFIGKGLPEARRQIMSFED